MSDRERAAREFPYNSNEASRKRWRTLVSSSISEESFDFHSPSGKVRLYVTTAVRVETDGGLSIDEFSDAAAATLVSRLSKAAKR